MEKKESPLSRREFLKVSGLASASLIMPERTVRIRPTESIAISERVVDILGKTVSLSFDSRGNLVINRYSEPVFSHPTLYNQENHRESDKLSSIDLFVIHYDATLPFFADGRGKTALETVEKGLNDRYVSVHWCIDQYPIRTETNNQDYGYGILQSQMPSGDVYHPYQGKHIVKYLTDALVFTKDLYKELGIMSNLNSLAEIGIQNLNYNSVGTEQVGTNFSISFPDNFPPEQQIANILSLSLAIMKQYKLTAWDIVGHHEIQEKQDPGDEYMATLRFLIGLAGMKRMISERYIFGDYLDSYYNYFREFHLGPLAKYYDYFSKVGDYYRSRDRYGQFDKWDNFVGYSQLLEDVRNSIEYYPHFHLLRR